MHSVTKTTRELPSRKLLPNYVQVIVVIFCHKFVQPAACHGFIGHSPRHEDSDSVGFALAKTTTTR